MQNLNELSLRCHGLAKAKGFWPEGGRHVGECLMLIVTELSEALEAHRHEKYCLVNTTATAIPGRHNRVFYEWFGNNVKDTVQDEMADAVIRIMDFCGRYEIDIERLWQEKNVEWNERKLGSFLGIGNFGALLLQSVGFVYIADIHHGNAGMKVTIDVFGSLMNSLILLEHTAKAWLGSDLWWHVNAKLVYNEGREYLHGKVY